MGAGDCLAAVLGQNALERPLMGQGTVVHVFVAMHLFAQEAGQPHAWHCWVLPTLRCVVDDGAAPSDVAAAVHALGGVAALCESVEVARASGPVALGDLLTAIEHVM